MSDEPALNEYLVISRGQWDAGRDPAEIQQAIDAFYDWHAQCVAQGRMLPGQRLSTARRLVAREGTTDGPFAEAKEVIGGYWFILAKTLDEAAALAAKNPCLAFGLRYEVRPIEAVRASAFALTNETPGAARA
jgi:hypothetical protein